MKVKPFNCTLNEENFRLVLDKQVGYRKKDKFWGLGKIVDLLLNEYRAKIKNKTTL